MKKILNTPESMVSDALKGLERSHPDLLTVDHENSVVLRAQKKQQGRVAVISGGGSGHEPLHAGFVGPGMLDAAVAGEVFTSPVPDQIAAATLAADAGAGVLHIVKNYTGDVMNFEMAAELAQAEADIEVASVITNDDVAVEDSTFTAGRRGVAGTVLVEKIAGAAAEAGASLEDVRALAQRVNDGTRSMGVALTSVTVPAHGKPSFDLGENEMEVGIGIHGEPGRHREPLQDAKALARTLVEPILQELPGDGNDVIVLVNGMGGTPLIELYVLADAVGELLDEKGLSIARPLVGNFVTSQEMAGASITLLRADEEILKHWDAPVHTAALRWG